MSKLFIPALAMFLQLGCHAQEAPTLGQRLGQAFEKAAKATGATKDSMDAWKKTIGAGSVCGGDSLVAVCKWDVLGIEIGSGIKRLNRVEFINIYFNEDPRRAAINVADVDVHGKPVPAPWEVKGRFPGYFELEGYGIDRHTKFWEIRASVHRKHGLRCGLRDCTHPLGALKDNIGIGMALTKDDEYGELWELSLNLKNE